MYTVVQQAILFGEDRKFFSIKFIESISGANPQIAPFIYVQSRNFHLAESFAHGKQTKGLGSGVTTTTHYHQTNIKDFHFGVNQPKVSNQVQTALKYYKSSILRVPGNF